MDIRYIIKMSPRCVCVRGGAKADSRLFQCCESIENISCVWISAISLKCLRGVCVRGRGGGISFKFSPGWEDT